MDRNFENDLMKMSSDGSNQVEKEEIPTGESHILTGDENISNEIIFLGDSWCEYEDRR